MTNEDNKIKRYLVFAGDNYYACGGWSDYVCSSDSKEEAISLAKSFKKDWWQVVDSYNPRIVQSSIEY